MEEKSHSHPCIRLTLEFELEDGKEDGRSESYDNPPIGRTLQGRGAYKIGRR